MKAFHHAAAALLCLWLLSSGPVHAGDSHATHSDHGPAKLALDHGKKWSTDAPLRKSMDTLNGLFATHLDLIRKEALLPEEYKILGDLVHQEVSTIVAQCKLTPQADAMLHLVIAEMLTGADMLTGKTPGKPREGANAVVSALNHYGQYFDHPAWKPLR